MATSAMTKTKVEAIKARARAHAAKVWHGGKGTAMAAGVGAAAGILLDSVKDIDALKGPYKKGLALIVGGHLLKKKSHDAGTALAAVGGLKIALDYQGKSLVGEPSSTTTTPAKGFDDAGDMDDEAGYPGARRRQRRRHHRNQWNNFGAWSRPAGAVSVDDAEGMDEDD